MKKVFYLLSAIAIFSVSPRMVSAQGCGDKGKEAKLYALTFHADYCGACKNLKPNVMVLQPKLEGKAVEWVKFDFTTAETKEKSKELASELGVSDIYEQNQATGFVILVDADSKKTVGKLTSRQSSDDMYKIVIANL
ncbi:MAG: hypothetical protein KAT15_12375 [Bacteroidales bacterium]|nr:hypothetical protein [Bacteroidales bacterium]